MDSLALLCDLYGDGKTKLARLKTLGCRETADLERVSLEELAQALDGDLDLARRFRAEALTSATPGPIGVGGGAASGASETPLRPDLIDGLDLPSCVRLRAHGIDSVEGLAGVEALELSRAMDLGVTRIMRLQFLARRMLGHNRSESAVGDKTVVPAPPRRPQDRDEGTRFSPSETGFTARPPELERELSSYARRAAP